jgi:hypothetical protein
MRTILILYIHDGDSQKGYGTELTVMKMNNRDGLGCKWLHSALMFMATHSHRPEGFEGY